MQYYINTEFLEGKQDKRILCFKYGETKPTKDFNLYEAWNRNNLDKNHTRNYKQKDNYWIRENILKPIYNKLANKEFSILGYDDGMWSFSHLKKLISKYGKTNKQIATEIIEFTK
jgi:hypothetical protein